MKEILNKLNAHNLPTDEFRKEKKILCLNENPYGCSKRVKKIIIDNIKYNEYPDDNCSELRKKLADLYNVSKDNIMIGNGSGEILQILSRSILSENDEVITCVPTYPYYLVETMVENATLKEVELKNDRFNIDGILEGITEQTKIIYITNPNNPIGTIISEDEANKLIKHTRENILIVFDEAYYEYAKAEDFPNIMEKISKHKNVCILRTFSKAYGLAAMRVGYIIGSEELINNLNKVRLTFNISKISQLAAQAAIEDCKFVTECREKNYIVKQRIYKCLEELKIPYIPSETNFVVIEDENKAISKVLMQNDIIVKTFVYNSKNYIRLTLPDIKYITEIEKLLKSISF